MSLCTMLVCLVSASGHAAALHYDGFYRYHEPSDDVGIYLRFYSDGTALSTATTGTPDEIIGWFHRESKADSGHFTVQGDQIHLTTFGFEWRNDCAGSIEDAALLLRCGDSDVAMKFEFVPMRLTK